jgi:hypothetical protein
MKRKCLIVNQTNGDWFPAIKFFTFMPIYIHRNEADKKQ